MIVRSTDSTGDWEYGAGKNNYKKNRDAVAQNIRTRLKMFLGNCFFAMEAGIDWFNLLGGKDLIALNLAVRATILNTEDVISLNQITLSLDDTRNLFLTYEVTTVYGRVIENENILVQPAPIEDYLLWNDTDLLLLSDDGFIVI